MTTTATTQTWRDEAICSVLHAESVAGQGIDALLRAIRLRGEGVATLILWDGPSRLHLANFLEQQAGDYRSMLAGSDSNRDGDKTFPYCGWYGFTWEGAWIELVLLPSTSSNGVTLCLSDDEAALQRFGVRL